MTNSIDDKLLPILTSETVIFLCCLMESVSMPLFIRQLISLPFPLQVKFAFSLRGTVTD